MKYDMIQNILLSVLFGEKHQPPPGPRHDLTKGHKHLSAIHLRLHKQKKADSFNFCVNNSDMVEKRQLFILGIWSRLPGHIVVSG